MKKLLFILLFGLLYSNIAIPNANSFSLNENDRFGCTAEAGGYAITIKKKFSDNYFAIENKIRGRKDLGFARFTGDSLESFWIDDETNDLKVHLLTPEDDKYTDWWFLVSLTKEEIESLAQYVVLIFEPESTIRGAIGPCLSPMSCFISFRPTARIDSTI